MFLSFPQSVQEIFQTIIREIENRDQDANAGRKEDCTILWQQRLVVIWYKTKILFCDNSFVSFLFLRSPPFDKTKHQPTRMYVCTMHVTKKKLFFFYCGSLHHHLFFFHDRMFCLCWWVRESGRLVSGRVDETTMIFFRRAKRQEVLVTYIYWDRVPL